jgi:hypothetical protein
MAYPTVAYQSVSVSYPSVNSIESAGAHCTKRQIAIGGSNVGSAPERQR